MADSKKILVVEDERALQNALELKLSNEGYKVTSVSDGDQAKSQLESDSFDLILLDLVMPVADGFTVLRYMKESSNITPVIIMSNLSQKEDMEKAQALGAKYFFIKSDSPLSKIIEQVRKLTS